jgi:hypothetical protein
MAHLSLVNPTNIGHNKWAKTVGCIRVYWSELFTLVVYYSDGYAC